jgi:hypothetical protein
MEMTSTKWVAPLRSSLVGIVTASVRLMRESAVTTVNLARAGRLAVLMVAGLAAERNATREPREVRK